MWSCSTSTSIGNSFQPSLCLSKQYLRLLEAPLVQNSTWRRKSNTSLYLSSLVSLYHDHDTELMYKNSPFHCGSHTFNYFEPDEFRTMINQDIRNSSSFFHLNCRGLSANWESFKSLMCDLQSNTFMFDFIAISEIFKHWRYATKITRIS